MIFQINRLTQDPLKILVSERAKGERELSMKKGFKDKQVGPEEGRNRPA